MQRKGLYTSYRPCSKGIIPLMLCSSCMKRTEVSRVDSPRSFKCILKALINILQENTHVRFISTLYYPRQPGLPRLKITWEGLTWEIQHLDPQPRPKQNGLLTRRSIAQLVGQKNAIIKLANTIWRNICLGIKRKKRSRSIAPISLLDDYSVLIVL